METSNRKGQIAATKVQMRALELGYTPSIPIMDCRYDMIIDDGKRLWRVQIKYGNRKPTNSAGAIGVRLSYETRGRRQVYTYNPDEVDALIVYLPKIDRLCWFNSDIFARKHELLIRLDPPLNGQKAKILYAHKYFW